ncbi:hypothetical protein RLDS_12220 [Sphingobium lactosutens DS20]|uniref:Uncharacterized protein n=1 Tax=Sphingobium lactosutens DS20 TaxID=1331060 RepID=T0IZ32_9SPHN|nr:hypothetical protein RLDS_12220 [Sphingobium lactosutens DS20]
MTQLNATASVHYEEQQFVAYLRLLNAKAEDASWKEVADRATLRSGHGRGMQPAIRGSHFGRAQWLSHKG